MMGHLSGLHKGKLGTITPRGPGGAPTDSSVG